MVFIIKVQLNMWGTMWAFSNAPCVAGGNRPAQWHVKMACVHIAYCCFEHCRTTKLHQAVHACVQLGWGQDSWQVIPSSPLHFLEVISDEPSSVDTHQWLSHTCQHFKPKTSECKQNCITGGPFWYIFNMFLVVGKVLSKGLKWYKHITDWYY